MITRCKDCVYGEALCEKRAYLICKHDGFKTVHTSFFCAYGRKKIAKGYDNAAILEEMEKESEKKR